jgi:hypothetical protein
MQSLVINMQSLTIRLSCWEEIAGQPCKYLGPRQAPCRASKEKYPKDIKERMDSEYVVDREIQSQMDMI